MNVSSGRCWRNVIDEMVKILAVVLMEKNSEHVPFGNQVVIDVKQRKVPNQRIQPNHLIRLHYV